MSVKFQLKKDAYMKKGSVGFSYTTYFWEFFVPIFRGDGKGFLMLFITRILLLSPGSVSYTHLTLPTKRIV